MKSERYDVAIIGSGSAGYPAAIYATRDGLKTVLFAGPVPGGQLTSTTMVENYPGFPDGILGFDLMTQMRAQAEKFGAEIVDVAVDSVDVSQRPFKLETEQGEVLAETVIIATGASPRKLGLESEARLTGHGVSYCATCDGFFFRGQDAIVVGGGDSAMEDALSLARVARSVTIVNRTDSFKASRIMLERAQSEPRISFLLNKQVKAILESEGLVSGVELVDTKTGEASSLLCAAVFIAIGHLPNVGMFKGQLEITAGGLIAVDGVKTSVPGVFAAGDVMNDYRQAVIAAGFAAMAAIDASHFIRACGQAGDSHEPVDAEREPICAGNRAA